MYDSPEVQRENEFRSCLAGTGLSAGKARYYNPAIGRFISEDPIRFHGGMNFYAYTRNLPSMFADPMGLKCCPKSINVKCQPVYKKPIKGVPSIYIDVKICAEVGNPEDCEFKQWANQIRNETPNAAPPPTGYQSDDPMSSSVTVKGNTMCMIDTPGWPRYAPQDTNGTPMGPDASFFPAVLSAQFVTRIQEKSDPSQHLDTTWGYTISCANPQMCGFAVNCH